MATLKWAGRYIPQAFVVADNEGEEKAIQRFKKPNYARIALMEGRLSVVLAATNPLPLIHDIKRRVEHLGLRHSAKQG